MIQDVARRELYLTTLALVSIFSETQDLGLSGLTNLPQEGVLHATLKRLSKLLNEIYFFIIYVHIYTCIVVSLIKTNTGDMENWPILTYYNDIYNGKHFAIFS